MAGNDNRPVPDFIPDLSKPAVSVKPAPPEGQWIPGRNPNRDKLPLGLPPGSDVLSRAQLNELFEEWRADYAAAKAERESPRPEGPAKPPSIDMDLER